MTYHLELLPVKDIGSNYLDSLLQTIWSSQNSYDQVQLSLTRFKKHSEFGEYFYLKQDAEVLGITGYFPILNERLIVLRHHGTSKKGTGKISFDLLVDYLNTQFPNQFDSIVEFIPEDRKDIISSFKKWGFQLVDESIPSWQPQQDYYKHVMKYYLSKSK